MKSCVMKSASRIAVQVALSTALLSLAPGAMAQAEPASPRGSDAPCVENFENIDALYNGGGWSRHNRSTGTLTGNEPTVLWNTLTAAQGAPNFMTFGAHRGTPYSRMLVNAIGIAGEEGTGSAWTVTPVIAFAPGAKFAFWTRSVYQPMPLGDRLFVRTCAEGQACENVGTSADDFGDFSHELLAINRELFPTFGGDGSVPENGYPTFWTRYEVDLPASGSGRIAFHYHIPNVGYWPGWNNGVLVAIDSAEVTGTSSCPFASEAIFSDGFDASADGSQTITQNSNTTVVEPIPEDAVCGLLAESNFYLRRFALGADHGLNERVLVDSVDIGIARAGASGELPVKLFSIPHASPLTYANMTPIGSAQMPVQGDENLFIRNVPITGVVENAAVNDLVVQIELPRGVFEYLVGTNSYPQSAPSYVASQCQVMPDEPSDWSTVERFSTSNSLIMMVNLAEHPYRSGAPQP